MSDAGVNLELLEISAMIGSVLPIAVAVLKQDRLSQRANTAIAVGTALAAAAIVVWSRHHLAPETIGINFVIMYTTAVAFDYGLWMPTRVTPTIQRRTSRRRNGTLPWTPARWPAGIESGSTGSGGVERRAHDRADLARC